MNVRKTLFSLLFLIPGVCSAESLTSTYLRVEKKWVEAQNKSSIKRAYDEYVGGNPIAGLSYDDMNIFKALIADGDVVSFKLRCQGNLSSSASQNLNLTDSNGIAPVCENGVRHMLGSVLRPRVLTLQYAGGLTRQITLGLKKPASGFCSAIENQQGVFLTAVNSGYTSLNSEENSQFHAQEAYGELFDAPRTQRLGMALYRCCQPVDNGKKNCLKKIGAALLKEGLRAEISSD